MEAYSHGKATLVAGIGPKFNSDAKPHILTDDRFGCFLDNFHETGPRKIFSEISLSAFATFNYFSITWINLKL